MSRMVIPRLNHASNFNFFFSNVKKGLLVDQSFISNHFLSFKSKHVQASTSSTPGLFQTVAVKMLNCQDNDLLNRHVPFPVKSRPNRSNGHESSSSTITTLSTTSSSPSSTSSSSTSPLLDQPAHRTSLKKLISPYIKLSKPRLTMLVTLSSICLYAMSPNAVALPELTFLFLGTMLTSSAANAINMGREPDFDRQMARTSLRPVVTGAVTPTQAYTFACLAGTVGCSLLYLGVNPEVAALGFANIVLYSWIYTSLKRKHIINTWIGAIVGAIPPLMGWAALLSLWHPGAWCLAALLYAWQFPHFNSLSHNIAGQYKSAGYVMTAAENPRLNARVALRYSLLMFPICFGLTYFGVTDWVFPIDLSIANAWMTYGAYLFWRQQRSNYGPASLKVARIPTPEGLNMANIYAKKLFWCSVWQLPVVLTLAMLHKKGQWDRLFAYCGYTDGKRQLA